MEHGRGPTPSPSERPATRPPEGVAHHAYPVGVAPVAARPSEDRQRSLRRRPRLVATAAITGAMVLMPFSSATATARERDQRAMEVAAAELQLRGRAAILEGKDAAGPGERPAPAARRPAPQRPTHIAAVSGIRLYVPSMETALVGFHEAAMPGSLEMASVAPLEADHNPRPRPEIGKTQPNQVAPVMVLPTRNRAAPPSTAIDIAIPEGEEILAPIDGTVTAVLPYALYGKYPDVRVEIQPKGRPDLRVVMIHVSDVEVEAGDELVGGQTPVAGSATPLPFESQIDRFTIEQIGHATPHVHIEVQSVR